jgi:hypothetical protein
MVAVVRASRSAPSVNPSDEWTMMLTVPVGTRVRVGEPGGDKEGDEVVLEDAGIPDIHGGD